MASKTVSKNFNRILLAVLIVIGVCLFVLLHIADKSNLKEAQDNLCSFTKHRLTRFDMYRTNDQVKSLVRLLDKTTGLGTDMTRMNMLNEEALNAFADEQRVSGVLVLDPNLQIVIRSSHDRDGLKIWNQMIQHSYVTDIAKYPNKTYTVRISLDDELYDVAVVARQDAPGVLLTYLKKNKFDIDSGDLSLYDLFTDFPFEMDGIVVISEDGQVLSSNRRELIGQKLEKVQQQYNADSVRLDSEDGVWYVSSDSVGRYLITSYFPINQVFMRRNVAMGIYVLVAILILMFNVLAKNRVEKKHLSIEQKRLRIINAIGWAYFFIMLVDLKENRLEVLKNQGSNVDIPNDDGLQHDLVKTYAEKNVAESFRQSYMEFFSMKTVVQRLEGKTSLVYNYQTVDGKWCLALIVPQRYDEQGNLDAVLVAVRDVTADKQNELKQSDALKNALAVAEHANKAKTVFLSNMSHDIRTPMNAILGFTALAQTHMDDKEQVQEYLSKINTSGTHLLSLINDILDMSRIESGSVKLEETPLHMPDVLHDIRAIIQGLINTKSQNLFIDTQDVIHEEIIADRLRLNQVLLNIVGNAIKYTPTGGDIIIRLAEKPCQIKDYTTYEFTIKDTGIGMSEEFIGHIFDSFSRESTDEVNEIQGTGLGMAITRNIVDMMGGTIAVESEVGKGSTFTVTINFRLADRTIICEPIPELLGARALVVDDDINTCRSVCKMLRSIKMRPDWTTSGKEAVLHAQDSVEINDEYSVYIIDYLMPDMNGIETVRRIRRVIGDGIPIIVLTAYDWSDIETEAREAGVTAFVGKPLFMSELRNVLTKPVEVPVEKPEGLPEVETDYSGKRILLVEDNELNREIATTILGEYGLEIDTAEDGIEAVNIINESPEDKYDLILMDIQMPRMDGYTATREIRTLANNKKANIPIVAMTANAFEEDKKKAFEVGMNGHLVKPIDVNLVLKMLNKLLK